MKYSRTVEGYTKKTKSKKFYSIQMGTIHYKICQNLSFLCSLEYEAVCIEILHHCSIASLAISKILFRIF